MRPPIAPPPYKVEALPFINSICLRSNGGILKTPKPPLNPSNKGIPSFKICVYCPLSPCILTVLLPLVTLVCCICTPLTSPNMLAMLPGFILFSSSISSLPNTSTFNGEFSIRWLFLVDEMIMTSSKFPFTLCILIITKESLSEI